MAVMVYKCPKCGAALEFDAEVQQMTCSYCGSVFTPQEALVGEVNVEPEDIREETPEQSEKFNAHLKAWHCPECGADIVAEENVSATFCRFCGSPTLVETNLTGDYRPVSMIPFKISKEEAKSAFLKWCHNGRYTPKDFASEQQLDKITGMYVPFWLFDCYVEGIGTGTGTKVRTWIHGDYQYVNTQYYRILRRARMRYFRVPADGASAMDNEMMDALEPFDYDQLIRFDMPYLSGYMAEKYDESHKVVYPRIEQRVRQYTQQKLRTTISGYSNLNFQGQTNFQKVDACYSLLPVWMLTYRYKGQRYMFAMNGQTGKVVGHPPKSNKKVALWSALYGAITFGSLFLLGGLLL